MLYLQVRAVQENKKCAILTVYEKIRKYTCRAFQILKLHCLTTTSMSAFWPAIQGENSPRRWVRHSSLSFIETRESCKQKIKTNGRDRYPACCDHSVTPGPVATVTVPRSNTTLTVCNNRGRSQDRCTAHAWGLYQYTTHPRPWPLSWCSSSRADGATAEKHLVGEAYRITRVWRPLAPAVCKL